MSQQTTPQPEAVIPVLELRHRLALSMEHAGLSVEDMADHLGKSPGTIRNYLAGRTSPDRSTIRDWASRCGVDFGWVNYKSEYLRRGSTGSGWLRVTAA